MVQIWELVMCLNLYNWRLLLNGAAGPNYFADRFTFAIASYECYTAPISFLEW